MKKVDQDVIDAAMPMVKAHGIDLRYAAGLIKTVEARREAGEQGDEAEGHARLRAFLDAFASEDPLDCDPGERCENCHDCGAKKTCEAWKALDWTQDGILLEKYLCPMCGSSREDDGRCSVCDKEGVPHPAEAKLQELTRLAKTFAEYFVSWSLNSDGMIDPDTMNSAFELCNAVGVHREDKEEEGE